MPSLFVWNTGLKLGSLPASTSQVLDCSCTYHTQPKILLLMAVPTKRKQYPRDLKNGQAKQCTKLPWSESDKPVKVTEVAGRLTWVLSTIICALKSKETGIERWLSS